MIHPLIDRLTSVLHCHVKVFRSMDGVKFTFSLLVLVVLCASTLAEKDMEVSCIFKEDCILPCSFQGGTDAEIHWTTTKETSGSVHHYRDNQDQLTDQDQHFRGRTSLFKDKISRGNASLQLTGVKVQDEGRYRCYTSTISGNQESFINLRVDALVPKVHIRYEGGSIVCSSEGIYPEPELTWSISPPSNVPVHSKTEAQQTEQQLYNIRSSLKLSDRCTCRVYACTVSTRSNKNTSKMYYSGRDCSGKSSPKALIPVFEVAVIAGLITLFLCFKRMTCKSQLKSSKRKSNKKQTLIRTVPCDSDREKETNLIEANRYLNYELLLSNIPLLPLNEEFSCFQTCMGSSLRRRDSSHFPYSHTEPSLSQIPSTTMKDSTQADMCLKDCFEEFTPDITVDENKETYKFSCSRPGLYRCSETGLVFHMAGEGDVVYRIVPWNRRLLTQHHKKPAGPLFDIKCLQQSVCQLHLPHCEIRSTGGCKYLSVAHVKDEGVEFITPLKITETHVIINITGFSDLGNVKDENSPPDPVRALVLPFYKKDPEYELNVFLLPENIVVRNVLRDVQRLWMRGDYGRYIGTAPHCKLRPKQVYTLSTSPEDDTVLVQPTLAEFDEQSYFNFFPSYQVILERNMKHIKLFLKDERSSLGVWKTITKYMKWFSRRSHSVWERRVCLLSTGVRNHFMPSALTLASNGRLTEVRTSFINAISEPVLKSLLDKLLEKNVITGAEMESADVINERRNKARFVIDTVSNKGEAASSEMIEFLCQYDPFLCEHLGLM